MSGYREIAAAVEGLAGWLDDSLAGGEPPKWVAQQGALGLRHIAQMARSGELDDGVHVIPDGQVKP